MKKKILTTTLKPVIAGPCLELFSCMDFGSYKQIFKFCTFNFEDGCQLSQARASSVLSGSEIKVNH